MNTFRYLVIGLREGLASGLCLPPFPGWKLRPSVHRGNLRASLETKNRACEVPWEVPTDLPWQHPRKSTLSGVVPWLTCVAKKNHWAFPTSSY